MSEEPNAETGPSAAVMDIISSDDDSENEVLSELKIRDGKMQSQSATRIAPSKEITTGKRFEGFLSWYMKLFDESPILTKSATAAFVGAVGAVVGSKIAADPNSRRRHVRAKGGRIDWSEVLSFALYGALIGGPAGHYWEKWLEYHGPESESSSMLFDQMLAQPPRILIQFVLVDLLRSILREFPAALNRSWSHFPQMVATSWGYWPLAVYIMLRFLRKRKHYIAGTNFCSLVWAAYFAKQRKKLVQAP